MKVYRYYLASDETLRDCTELHREMRRILNTRASNLATFHLTQDNNDKLSLVKIVVFENGFCIGNRNVRQSN